MGQGAGNNGSVGIPKQVEEAGIIVERGPQGTNMAMEVRLAPVVIKS